MNLINHKNFFVFYGLTRSYNYSQELKLCEKFLHKALPQNSTIITTNIDDNTLQPLHNAIVTNLNRISENDYVLIMQEPALMIMKDSIDEMIKILAQHPHIECVIPSDNRDHSSLSITPYFTLRGFQQFLLQLQDKTMEYHNWDNRKPDIFLIKGDALKSIDIPQHPLDIPKNLKNTVISQRAFIHSFKGYYNERREEIIPIIPPNTKTFLDLGCARGNFGRLIKSKIPGSYVVGIEQNEHEAHIAQNKLDKVIIGNVLNSCIDEKFDCVTCLDMLEHIVDPEALLLKIKNDFLTPNGVLVLSIPNIGHWSIIEDLLAGRWDYIPAGTLCTTHLRFFTLHTIKNLLKESGFRVKSVHSADAPPPKRLLSTFDRLKQYSKLEINEASLTALSYYIVAQKS